MADKTIARRMAEFALELQFDDLPTEVIDEVKRYLRSTSANVWPRPVSPR